MTSGHASHLLALVVSITRMTALPHCATSELNMESMCTPKCEPLCNISKGERAKMSPCPQNARLTLHIDNEFLKRRHYIRRKGKRRGELFAVAIKAFSCQDCSKAGAAEVDIMQHMLPESNLFKFPWRSSDHCHTERMQVCSVVRRKQKQELLKIPPPPPLVR